MIILSMVCDVAQIGADRRPHHRYQAMRNPNISKYLLSRSNLADGVPYPVAEASRYLPLEAIRKMKALSRSTLLFTITCTATILCSLCHAQTVPATLNSSIELVRAGAQADRVTLITAAMNFTDKEGSAFWPIYRKYEYERSTLDDRRVGVIKDYAAKYPSLTDADAKAMAEKMFDCDASLAALKKRYYKKFNAVLPALTVTKFFQLEHRIDLMMDTNVESSLPPLSAPLPNEGEK